MVSGDQDTCNHYEFSSSDDVPKKQKQCGDAVVKPLAPSPLQREIESSEEDSPQPVRKPSKRERVEESDGDSDESEESVTPANKINKALFSLATASSSATKARSDSASSSSATKARSDSRVRAKFPMVNGDFQYMVIKLLTEIRDTVKGGQNSYVHMPDEVIVKRMSTIEEINTTEEELVDKPVFVSPCQSLSE